MVLFIILVILSLGACAFLLWTIHRYKNFIVLHSEALTRLKEINARYIFHTIPCHDLENSYDNMNFYDDIEPIDYLIYELVYKHREIRKAITEAEGNRRLFAAYCKDIESECVLGRYGTDKAPKWWKLLIKIEKKLLNELYQRPCCKLCITVTLSRKISNGTVVERKNEKFDAQKILSLIERLLEKSGDFYLNEDIWQSICRVERGKVTNKIRFAVYARDGYRCRKCGSTQDLEIDHIFPISKGGKSNFENLQTLCHWCNLQKSNTVEPGVRNPYIKGASTPYCTECGAPMVRRKGKNGEFYGCSNYPKCQRTQNL